MTVHSYTVESFPHPAELTGDPLWSVVEYVDGKPTGGDHRWVRERFAYRAAELYREYPELHGRPTSMLRDAGMIFDTDEEHEREVSEHVDRLRSAGFDVQYIDARDVADARDNGRVSPRDRDEMTIGAAHVDLGRVAAGEDMANQVDTVRRSNYRSLKRDLEHVEWVDLSYVNVDHLGVFVADLDSETVDLLIGLAEEYPVYDEDDESALEHEEITASVQQYVIFDVGREMDLEVSERWHDLATEAQESMIFDVARDDLYPEHNGLEVVWQYDQLAKRLTERLS